MCDEVRAHQPWWYSFQNSNPNPIITHCVTAARRRAPRTNKIFLHYLLEHAWPYHNGSYGSYGGVSTTGCSYNQAAVSAHLQVGWCRDAAAMKII